jgi:UDP-glucose 4-epimerase
MLTWVVGAGGMLGTALARRARVSSSAVFDACPVPWSDSAAAQDVLRADARRFAEQADGQPWSLFWAAGASVVASEADSISAELVALEVVLAAVAKAPPSGPGAVFVTSSAGGLYAGASGPPFSCTTQPHPISPYGRLKLDQEEAARTIVGGRIPLVLGRFSNLYGPGNNTEKSQGLISMLCRACVRRTPLNLYVSMDTVRDYLYVDDAAELAWNSTMGVVGQVPPRVRVEVIASGRAATVAEIVATIQTVAHRRVPLALGTDASARHQVPDLRLVPSVDVDAVTMTPLPAGIKQVFDAAISRAV